MSPDAFRDYAGESRTIERHRAIVRQHLGFREATVKDARGLTAWLVETMLPHQRKIDSLIEAVYERCRALRLEPPSPRRIERLVRSAIQTADQRFFKTMKTRLSLTTREQLDALLSTDHSISGSTADTKESISGAPGAYPHLQPILTRHIRWDLIQQQYDEMIKYTTALRLGTADAESILRRFTRSSTKHPTYRAIAELGKIRKTIFLCHYLHDPAVQREVQAGLNVIENWNSANGFTYYGKGGEIATNNREEQELVILSLHLLQICLVYINTLMLQQVLGEERWCDQMQAEDLRASSPLFYSHVNPYGDFKLDLQKRLEIK